MAPAATLPSDPRAAFFDERADAWEERCYPREVRERLRLLAQAFPLAPGETVLDLGSGTGILIPYVRERIGHEGTIASLDVSFEMLRRAAEKHASGKGCAVQATAMRLPLRDGSMDTILCFAAFPHFSDKPSALAEMRRTLKAGGALCIAHLLSREELSRHHGGHAAVAEDKLPDDESMRRLCLDAGFKAPRIVDVPGRYLALTVKE